MKEKSYDSAAELLELLIEQDPRNVEYLNALSSCYYFEGKLEEAKELCLTILDMDASCEDAYRRCVAIYEKQNDYAAINAPVSYTHLDVYKRQESSRPVS